jgi:hypothetical protein
MKQKFHRVKLTPEEIELFLGWPSASEQVKNNIISSDAKNTILEVTESGADTLRDLCGDRLQVEGFDENYQPTKLGRILESLIDKLYVK